MRAVLLEYVWMCVDGTIENKYKLFKNMQFVYSIINKIPQQIHKCKPTEQ